MTDRLLSPSKITAWLDCAHYLTLRERLDAGLLDVELSHFGSFARLLADKGSQHEAECLAHYRAAGRSIYEVPAREPGERFDDWVTRVGTPWGDGFDVIYQMPFVHDGMRGIADFLVRIEGPSESAYVYEPVDAKLARTEAKPGQILQLCFYADALRAATGTSPDHLHIWLGSGRIESFVTREFHPYWRRLRNQLRQLFEDVAPTPETHPEPCDHCKFCEFAAVCDTQWRDEDSLVLVAGITTSDRMSLEASAIATLTDLAGCSGKVDSMRPERLAWLVIQAELQVEARIVPDGPPPFRPIEAGADPTWGRGLEWLPEPDDGDVVLDFEGDPFWTTDSGLFFLFGLIARASDGVWTYEARWAHDRSGEDQATGELIEYLKDRRASHPYMHAYHYNHTERSALERLAADHSVGEVALSEMVATGFFVDLYPIVRNAIQAGTESYGLKEMERLTEYQRGHEIDQGAAAVVESEHYMAAPDSSILERIAAYNEDDVRATLALRDWFVGLRPDDLPWRASRLDPEDEHPELDERIAALYAYGADTPEHLLGDLLGYWVREFRAYKAPKVARTCLETGELLDVPDVIAGLEFVGLEPRYGVKGKELKWPGARFRWQAQVVSADLARPGASILFGSPDGPTVYTDVSELEELNGEVVLVWNEKAAELGVFPSAVAAHDWVQPHPKPAALDDLAAGVLGAPGSRAPGRASLSLLRREDPVFTPGGGPPDGEFSDDLDAMCGWVTHLDGSCISIQGPPGTGKTYWGAHIVHGLIRAGRRVGITAMSHHAIDNLLEEILQVFGDKGDLSMLKAVRKVPDANRPKLPGVTYVTNNPPCAKSEHNLVAGTTWLFASPDMRGAPVDVLIVDEAGQLALADALAASTSAKNLVILGDPLQLPQVAQAVHPGGGGLSVLQHVLGDDVTMPPDRGVFLTETRRMHPDVCRFISEEIYEGRLESHPSCAQQRTAFGTGLRWLQADHDGCSTESLEEAHLVADEIDRLLGTPWVDQHGVTNPLTVRDFMVVAPYNDQVALLRETLDADPRTRGVPVGTVDKFQGREAAVVFFTMTTSSSDFMPRSAEFLFSRNRLNVAISRARCLAFLVCTEELLNSRARTIEEMRLISTLCSFVEYCGG
jgi:predicted RecB family nuclease